MSLSRQIVTKACSNSEFPGSCDVSYYEENRLRTLIRSTYPSCRITRIERLCNEHLFAAFKVRQFEMKNARVEEMIHATGAYNVSSITKTNLDWRKVSRGKYGRGVSFSKDAAYANKYCSRTSGYERAFIICDVLVNEVRCIPRTRFDNNEKYPQPPYDTYKSSNGSVYVKFEDFTFYPKYAIFYNNS